MVKVVLSGWKPTGIVGSFTKPIVTGDVNGYTLLMNCSPRSTNFTKISAPGTYLYMSKPAHAGVYLGEFTYNGKVYNVVECTTAWGGGVIYSWVDPDGTRRQYKGSRSKSYKWTDWGLLKWVEYNNENPYTLNGYDYSPVFDPVYYANKYDDLKKAFGYNKDLLWFHFVNNGMNEFRQASAEFNPVAYQQRYPDVANAYGDDRPLYYYHYVAYGKSEGRKGN